MDMSGLIIPNKGEGTAAPDAPKRRDTQQQAKPVSSEKVHMGFHVSKEFRQRVRRLSLDMDKNITDLFIAAIESLEEKRR